MLKAPEKQQLKLCSASDADEEPKKVVEIFVDDVFYDAVDTCEISIESTLTIEAQYCNHRE
jgi:hypothetical protein